ncbi:putative nucleotidyltransferase substrate binding domain-containing protein [Desulfocurvibacter africanus]|uniref:putative nucleotidyltransferase substrate binding domain-containing protein n=1 Tax=Desulfocurvibacter africanus TaxID=873 RepID=UPI00047FA3F9|nr:DUF294 nucleotidyltransferase-like domain-containing protein [Desulfocurvibacter africanus]
MSRNVHSVSPADAVEILQRTMPFSELPQDELMRLAKVCSIDFIPAGLRFIEQGKTAVDYLWIIQKGGVKSYLINDDGGITLLDIQGEGGTFGALAIVRGSLANFNVETVEDSFFYRISKQDFQSLMGRWPAVAQFYLRTLSDAYVHKAFAELRRTRHPADSGTRLSLFATGVGEVVRRELATINADETIRSAAERMGRAGVGSLVVLDGSAEADKSEVAGIVTDQDFRDKVAARGLSVELPVREIMSSPLLAVDEATLCFDALLTMMKNQVHHLGVRRAGRVQGMVTAHDFMTLTGRSPYSLFKDIVGETRLDGLARLAKGIPDVVRALFEEGARAGKVGRMVAVLNDLVLERLLTMLQEELGPPPLPFCWLSMGSEGRREQTIRTDQDNALIYQDYGQDYGQDNGHGPKAADADLKARADEYFARLGRRAGECLVDFGYPRCPGGIMVENPKWRMSLSAWKRQFTEWIARPEPKQVLFAGIFFDFRPVFGYVALGEALRDYVTPLAAREEVFLRHMAADCLRSRPPLTFFKSFIVEKDGEHKDALDIKGRGVLPLTEFGRVMALKHGLRETNSLDRFKALAELGAISAEFHAELREAYEFLMQVRIASQLRQMDEGRQPGNHVNPGRLSELEKRTLKEAFGVIGRMQSYVRETFRLNV